VTVTVNAVQPASSDALTRLADCPVVVVPSPSPAPLGPSPGASR
jgi:hypothetical protein